MRIMLDEEIARAILIGDGRSGASDDKIGETHIRPIATDAPLFRLNQNLEYLKGPWALKGKRNMLLVLLSVLWT